MTREQPEREIKGCQLGFIVGVQVHKQSANNMIYSAFQQSLRNFQGATRHPNAIMTYPMPRYSLRSKQQYQSMRLMFKYFC